MGLSEFPVEYSLGDWVQVREGYPDHHFRTPKYVQGKIGRIEGLCGIFPNPETLLSFWSKRCEVIYTNIETDQKYGNRPLIHMFLKKDLS